MDDSEATAILTQARDRLRDRLRLEVDDHPEVRATAERHAHAFGHCLLLIETLKRDVEAAQLGANPPRLRELLHNIPGSLLADGSAPPEAHYFDGGKLQKAHLVAPEDFELVNGWLSELRKAYDGEAAEQGGATNG
jgi:hypothetical protein